MKQLNFHLQRVSAVFLRESVLPPIGFVVRSFVNVLKTVSVNVVMKNDFRAKVLIIA